MDRVGCRLVGGQTVFISIVVGVVRGGVGGVSDVSDVSGVNGVGVGRSCCLRYRLFLKDLRRRFED